MGARSLTGLALMGLALAALGVADRTPPVARVRDEVRAAPQAVARVLTIGRSVRGRPVRAAVANGSRDGPLVLAVGCIHGTECAGMEAVTVASRQRPARGEAVLVPNLNPDGLALRTRLNAHGVDLNRNFAADWQAAGARGDPEYPGPQPFSEPETRLARRLIRALRPDVTIWFHQQVEPPLVRAWGPSVPAARAYARLADTPFRRLQWKDGTAPNWQNHRFPGSSSFVVELPWGEVPEAVLVRHAIAILELGRVLRRPRA